ncbi:MAG: hypothetical protein ACNI3H_00820 [Halarcobacter ebronensis]
MKEEYKMVKSSQNIIDEVSNSLRSTISQNVNEINRLKTLILENEVILENDI